MLRKKLIKTISRASSRVKLLQFVPKNSVCAEIGVWKGEYSRTILDKIKPKRLYLIDPWKFYPQFRRRWFGGKLAKSQRDMNKIYNDVVQKFRHQKAVIIIKDTSKNAASIIKNNSLDFLYIDGNHSYSFVKSDLVLYFPKVKKGGIIAGDDVTWGAQEGFPVFRALIYFLLKRRQSVSLISLAGGQFVFQKNEITKKVIPFLSEKPILGSNPPPYFHFTYLRSSLIS